MLRVLPDEDMPDTGDRMVRLTEQEVFANLRAVLELCAAGELRCSEKTRRPSAASIRAVEAHLAQGDFYAGEAIAAFAWPLLVQAGGLGTLDGTRLTLTPKGRAALGKPPAEVLRGLWQRWLTHAVIDEFSRIEEIKGQRIRNVLSAAKGRRQIVAGALAGCPPGEWIEVDTLFAVMQSDHLSPTVARNGRSLWRLYLGDPQYGSFGYDGCNDWQLLEGRYTLAVLFEYAATLGLVDVDYGAADGARDDFRNNWGGDCLAALSRYDGLRAIRLNALGSYVLGLTGSYRPTRPDAGRALPLTVLPNLDIVATGDIDGADRLVLSAHAEQSADRVWTASAASLLRALEQGRDLDEFAGFLGRRTAHELPGTLRTVIADVHRRGRRLTDLGMARVIECADTALATLIGKDPALRALCRRVGDRHLLVRPEQEIDFRKALRKLGYAVP